MQTYPDHFLLICATCQGGADCAQLQDLAEANLPQGFAVRLVDCMAACTFPRAVGFQAFGKASYLFGSIEEADDAALMKFAHQFQQSHDGWTKATERPKPLLRKTLARLPAMTESLRK